MLTVAVKGIVASAKCSGYPSNTKKTQLLVKKSAIILRLYHLL